MAKKVGEITIPVYEYNPDERIAPAYTGEGIAVWGARSRTGKDYLRIRILGDITVACFPVTEKNAEQ